MVAWVRRPPLPPYLWELWYSNHFLLSKLSKFSWTKKKVIQIQTWSSLIVLLKFCCVSDIQILLFKADKPEKTINYLLLYLHYSVLSSIVTLGIFCYIPRTLMKILILRGIPQNRLRASKFFLLFSVVYFVIFHWQWKHLFSACGIFCDIPRVMKSWYWTKI